MTFEERLHKILFEGWEDLGIQDPNIKSNFNYTDEEISAKAPRKYGMAYEHGKEAWDAMRFHPLYIEQVRLSLSRVMDQIYKIKNKIPREKIDPHGLVQAFEDAVDVGGEIAKDIGWGDPRDIVIAIQQHPLIGQLYKIREALKAS